MRSRHSLHVSIQVFHFDRKINTWREATEVVAELLLAVVCTIEFPSKDE